MALHPRPPLLPASRHSATRGLLEDTRGRNNDCNSPMSEVVHALFVSLPACPASPCLIHSLLRPDSLPDSPHSSFTPCIIFTLSLPLVSLPPHLAVSFIPCIIVAHSLLHSSLNFTPCIIFTLYRLPACLAMPYSPPAAF